MKKKCIDFLFFGIYELDRGLEHSSVVFCSPKSDLNHLTVELVLECEAKNVQKQCSSGV